MVYAAAISEMISGQVLLAKLKFLWQQSDFFQHFQE